MALDVPGWSHVTNKAAWQFEHTYIHAYGLVMLCNGIGLRVLKGGGGRRREFPLAKQIAPPTRRSRSGSEGRHTYADPWGIQFQVPRKRNRRRAHLHHIDGGQGADLLGVALGLWWGAGHAHTHTYSCRHAPRMCIVTGGGRGAPVYTAWSRARQHCGCDAA